MADCRFDFVPGGADDGAYTATTPTVDDLFIDLATFVKRTGTMDTSAAMEEQEHHRKTGSDFDVTFELPLDCGGMLRDLAVTLYPGGADDLGYTAGTALTTLKFDEIIFRQTNVLTNKNPKQSEWPKYRLDKKPWVVDLKKKRSTLGSTGAENLLQGNTLVGFNFVHAPSGETVEIDGYGIVQEWNQNSGGGEDLGWSILPYGAEPTVTASDANSILSLLIGNEVIRAKLLNDVASTGLDIDVTAIISMVELSFKAGASMLKFGLKPYGVAPTFAFA